MKITSTANYDPTTHKLTFTKHVAISDDHLRMLRRIERVGGLLRSRKLTDAECEMLEAMEDAKVLRTDPNDYHTTYYLNNASKKILASHPEPNMTKGDKNKIIDALHVSHAVVREGFHDDQDFREEALNKIEEALTLLGAEVPSRGTADADDDDADDDESEDA